MVKQRVDRSFSPVNQTYYTFGQSGFLQQLVNVTHGERNALGRLQDERVSRGDGVRQVPERDHAGKVEGNNGSGDAEGLSNHHLVDAAGDVFEVVALHHHGNATGAFDVLDCP